ncbi:unnamed protein product [Phaedon cochleariae]|uniref:Uncharacterized protein n=1 Tax=Phaedon cochleariae TaxID=80249 RepID=A0A9N9SFH8_PHACE|nr:unnamed protein product [Phaedon cochleariae]
MASVYHLYEEVVHIEDDIVMKFKLHAVTAKKDHFAATKIQSVFRGYVVRKEMKKLNMAATLIQKHVRGWLLRYHMPDILQEYHDMVCFKYYNGMATRIQARWRGYKVRKYEICIKDHLEEQEQMKKANEDMQKALTQQRSQGGNGSGVMDFEKEKIKIEKILKCIFNRHHLLRTQQKGGVLSIQGKDELSELEKLLKSVSWTDYMKNLRKLYNRLSKEKNENQYKYSDKKSRKQEDLLRTKEPSDISVQNGYLDKDIHEKPFIFSRKIEREPYERNITKTEKYKKVETKILRTFDKSLNISEHDFDLTVLKKAVKESDVPPYYIDFWFQKCFIHSL